MSGTYQSTYSRMHTYFPECVICHSILRTICDFVDQRMPIDLIVQYYYDHQDAFHNDQHDVPLFRAVFDRTGKPGARE